MYKAYKSKVSKELCATDITVERSLWHGTSVECAQQICLRGFDRSFAGKNGKAKAMIMMLLL